MDSGADIRPADQPRAASEGTWLQENVWKPMVAGSGVLQVYNTFASENNKAEIPQVHHAQVGTVDWMTQNVSSAAGAILPYVLAGKAMGAGMRGVGAKLGAEGALGRALASDRGALVLGAGAYDFTKAPNLGETRVGNAIGTMTAFTVFEVGNSKLGLNKGLPMMTSSVKEFTKQVAGRSLVGAVGATSGLEASHLYSTGRFADAKDAYNAMATGAFLNTALPVVQHGAGKAIDGFNNATVRGVPVNRYLQNRGWENTPELKDVAKNHLFARVLDVKPDQTVKPGSNRVEMTPQDTPANLAAKLSELKKPYESAKPNESAKVDEVAKLNEVAKPLERVALTEEQAKTLRSASDFAHELTAKFPQVDANGNINYYLAGSLATMLLIEGGGKMVPTKGTALPSFEPANAVSIPEAGMNHLSTFIRKIGDLDYLPLKDYAKQEVKLGKGGAGPAFDELTPSARDVFKESRDGSKVMADPVASKGDHTGVAIEVGGKTFYIANPIDALAYKLIHAAESFGSNESKVPTMNKDFSALLNGLESVYPRETLVNAVSDAVNQYNKNSPNGIYLRDYHPGMSPELKSFFNDVIAKDPNASYLSGLKFGQERGFGILRILGRMESDGSKRQLIDFINSNKDAIDLWQPTESLHNRMTVAAEILKNPELLKKIESQVKGEPTQESIAEALKTYTGMIREVGNTMPAGSMERTPVTSYLLDNLMRVSESNLAAELNMMNSLMQKGADPFSIYMIMDSGYFKGQSRSSVLSDLQNAASTLPPEQLGKFLYEYKKAIAETSEYDRANNRWIDITDAERPARAQSVMSEFGLLHQ